MSILSKTPRRESITRLSLIGDRVVDNEKELYLGYIRRLEIELELAHEQNRLLLNTVLAVTGVDKEKVHIAGEPQEPIRSSGMSFREAARRVREFERSQQPKEDTADIDKSISQDAERKVDGNRGFAV